MLTLLLILYCLSVTKCTAWKWLDCEIYYLIHASRHLHRPTLRIRKRVSISQFFPDMMLLTFISPINTQHGASLHWASWAGVYRPVARSGFGRVLLGRKRTFLCTFWEKVDLFCVFLGKSGLFHVHFGGKWTLLRVFWEESWSRGPGGMFPIFWKMSLYILHLETL